MTRKVEHAPETLARAKYLYEETVAPVDDIAAMLNLSNSNFYKRVKVFNWKRRRASKREFEFARALIAASAAPAALPEPPPDAPAVRREELTARRLALAEQKVAVAMQLVAATQRVIDASVKIAQSLEPATQAEAERAARTLSEVARTLAEAHGLLKPEREQADDETEDDTVPRDIDEFRAVLAQRIRMFIEERRLGIGQPRA